MAPRFFFGRKANRTANAMDWTMHDVLTDTGMEQAFHAFLTRQMAEENLNFWRATKGRYTMRLTQIIQTYIVTGAPQEINIGYAERQAIIDAMAQVNRAGLNGGVNFTRVTRKIDDARRIIFDMMEANFLLMFKRSDDFKEVAERREEMAASLGNLNFA